MLFACEITVENKTRNRPEYFLKFDPSLLTPNELKRLIQLSRELTRTCRRSRKYQELLTEIAKITKNATRGNIGFIVPFINLDPAYHALLWILGDEWGPIHVPIMWCDGGQTGKLFTEIDLCTRPSITYWASGRRAIALNPWSLTNLSDLDTIIDSSGSHKTGTIGASDLSITKFVRPSEVTYTVEFTAGSDTYIRSILLLIPSSDIRDTSDLCFDNVPAPIGTCDPNYYASIYMPLWGADVEISITQGYYYAIGIRFYM